MNPVIQKLAQAFLILGALHLGCVGILHINLVQTFLGEQSVLAHTLYGTIGAAGLISLL